MAIDTIVQSLGEQSKQWNDDNGHPVYVDTQSKLLEGRDKALIKASRKPWKFRLYLWLGWLIGKLLLLKENDCRDKKYYKAQERVFGMEIPKGDCKGCTRNIGKKAE